MVELISTIGTVAKITGKAVSLTKGMSGASKEVAFRREDLTAVHSSLEQLGSAFVSQADYLDYATQRQLIATLKPPVESWGKVAKKMVDLLERYEAKNFRRAGFWLIHKNEVYELRNKSQECKVSLLLAISAAASCVEGTHFRTLCNGLRGIHGQLQANHEESIRWMEGLHGTIQGNHAESRGWSRELNDKIQGNYRQTRDLVQDSNRRRMENHNEAMLATGEVDKKVHHLIVTVVVAETLTLMVIGLWWYYWRVSVEGKHGELKDGLQRASQYRRKYHDEAMAATMEVGKKVDALVKGLIVTGLATLVALAAAGMWWYFWVVRANVRGEVIMSKIKERLLPSKKEKPALKPKPKPKPELKPKASMQFSVPSTRSDPVEAVPAAPAHNNVRASPAVTWIATNTTSTTITTAGQGKDSAKKEEHFADVMTQLRKRQDDLKARAELGS